MGWLNSMIAVSAMTNRMRLVRRRIPTTGNGKWIPVFDEARPCSAWRRPLTLGDELKETCHVHHHRWKPGAGRRCTNFRAVKRCRAILCINGSDACTGAPKADFIRITGIDLGMLLAGNALISLVIADKA